MSLYGNMSILGKHGIDKEDEEMNIYANTDPINSFDVRTETENSETKRHQTPQHTGGDSVRNRSSRAAAVCLVLLCVLLLTAVIVLCVHIHTKSTNYTEERDQLLTRNMQLTKERDGLSSNNSDLLKKRDQLMQEKNELLKMDGWVYYQSSFYFISSKKKSWTESRRDCIERGADLIIINNRKEQEIVNMISGDAEAWIGLTDSEKEDTWKWVDGSTLTSGIWSSGEPNGQTSENCVLTRAQGWIDHRCNEAYRWFCEKKM